MKISSYPCPIVLIREATQFVHNLADVRRLKDSIVDAIVSHVNVGLSKPVDQLSTLCTHPFRLLHIWEGGGARSMGFDIPDGFYNRQSLSVFRVHAPLLP